ncbi:2-Hydroxyacid oxidase 1-like isoform X2 [Anopheles darlingi]|uniref:2-Hydroxyacid oxidase 1-like isoform X2 n=1 Tax=Anopheles darlingi TaxID=43151 RepID=UPI0020FFFD78|nr:2-Hydroxyacid oxidase 1-like isoform X2 [Anopheles darlingi]
MDSTNDQRASLPLAIGPLAIFKATLQRHSAVYHVIADVAKQYRIPYVHTSRSSVAMETLIDPDRSVVRWLELFPFEDARILRSLVRRAEKCRFRAIVLTLDENAQHINTSLEDSQPARKESFSQPDFQMISYEQKQRLSFSTSVLIHLSKNS